MDEEKWRDFFAQASKALAEVDYDGRYIVNMDMTSFHQNFITRAAERSCTASGVEDQCRGGRVMGRKAVTVMAAVVASAEALRATLLFDTKFVKGSHLRYCGREVILNGTRTGWSGSEIFDGRVQQVLVPRTNPLCNPSHKIVLFLDG